MTHGTALLEFLSFSSKVNLANLFGLVFEWMQLDEVPRTPCGSIPVNPWQCVPYLTDVPRMILVDRTTQGDREGRRTSEPTRDSKNPRNRLHSHLPTQLQNFSKKFLCGQIDMYQYAKMNLYFSSVSSSFFYIPIKKVENYCLVWAWYTSHQYLIG